MVRAMRTPLDAGALVASARRFDGTVFDAAMRDVVDEALADRRPVGQRQRLPERARAATGAGAATVTTASAAALAGEGPLGIAAPTASWPGRAGRGSS